MSTDRVLNLVDMQINLLGLQEDEQIKVKKCIVGYSQPNSILGKISWVVYRAFNAIKAIFGQSDWQIAKRIITHRIEQLIPEALSPVVPKIVVSQGAEKILKIMVELNEGKLETPAEIGQIVREMSFENIQQRFRNGMNFIDGLLNFANG